MKRFLILGPNGMAYKVLPKPIEEVIASDLAVEEVCVIAAQNEQGTGAEPKAFIVLKEAEDIDNTIKRLQGKCKEQLPDYMRPFSYVVLDALPKNAVGKTDVKALEEL